MKWFRVIHYGNPVTNPYVANIGDLKGIDENDLWRGFPIPAWNEDSWIQAKKPENDGTPDDTLQTYLHPPIYSLRLRQALSEYGIGGIQYLPLHVLRPDASEIPGYAIANIINLVDGALDLERSQYEVFPQDYFLSGRIGKLRALRVPVLRKEKLEGFNIVRLSEYKSPFYVSERFKTAFEDAGCTGHSFTEIKII